ncbi:protein of unknown function (DUF397) [Goodfellowiella coeruleoviolacea]|uniref:DUF397 domain-containing protein n=2 Tax=Goodfellowiella coeruleoviolacea TaxID=334858 RepID=A0AAE3GKC5_9PSEU|nr:protein of unknown function (DUF397) [Goodfellowiella coeruleoviolacea]
MNPDLNHELRWKNASNHNGSCVELAHTMTAVRDSKNPDGPVLTFGHAELTRFLAAVKAGHLDG